MGHQHAGHLERRDLCHHAGGRKTITAAAGEENRQDSLDARSRHLPDAPQDGQGGEAHRTEVSPVAQQRQPFAGDRRRGRHRPLRQRSAGGVRLCRRAALAARPASRARHVHDLVGHANSPVLYGDLVINVCMQDSLGGVSDKLRPATWWPITSAPASSPGRPCG